jgi:hypothetical protein
MKMTEYNKKIEQQRERLKTEALDNQVTAQETSARKLQLIIGGLND